MAFVQRKNTPLQDRRFSRAVSEMARLSGKLKSTLFTQFAANAMAAAMFGDNAIEKALRKFQRSYMRRNGLQGTLFTPNGERECARRRRQIAKGMIQVSA